MMPAQIQFNLQGCLHLLFSVHISETKKRQMKIFEWIHCKLQRVDHYSQVYGTKGDDLSVPYASCEEDDGDEAVGETGTETLLLHDMLNGILTIGTLSRHHCLMHLPCSDSEEECFAEGGGVAEAALLSVVAAREPPAESFRIKLSAEEERMMGMVKLHEVAAAAEKTLELPLLLDYKEPRTTLADLLASNAPASEADSACDQGKKSSRRRRSRGGDHKSIIADAKQPLPTLKSRALKKKKKKKIHPAATEGANKPEQPSIAAPLASDVF